MLYLMKVLMCTRSQYLSHTLSHTLPFPFPVYTSSANTPLSPKSFSHSSLSDGQLRGTFSDGEDLNLTPRGTNVIEDGEVLNTQTNHHNPLPHPSSGCFDFRSIDPRARIPMLMSAHPRLSANLPKPSPIPLRTWRQEGPEQLDLKASGWGLPQECGSSKESRSPDSFFGTPNPNSLQDSADSSSGVSWEPGLVQSTRRRAGQSLFSIMDKGDVARGNTGVSHSSSTSHDDDSTLTSSAGGGRGGLEKDDLAPLINCYNNDLESCSLLDMEVESKAWGGAVNPSRPLSLLRRPLPANAEGKSGKDEHQQSGLA
ncbi:unnamed protein product [Choristocarpus tenellus]